jgi:protein-disulfide isomerase
VDQPIETLDVETSPLDAGLEPSARSKYDIETGHDEPSSPDEMISRVTFNYVIIAITFLLVGIVVGAVGYERVAQTNARLVEQAVANALSDTAMQDVIQRSVASALETSGTGNTPRLDPNRRYEILTGDNPAFGPEDAVVTIVEFSDFQCGFCGRFAIETLQPLLAEYDGRVRFVYRDFIIFGQKSYEAAVAAECANDQGKFWEFHNLVFANQHDLTPELLASFAQDLELEMAAFQDCYDTEAHRDGIAADVSYGESLGLSGTPTFFINGRLVSGAQPIETFRQIIDSELAASAESTPPPESAL